MEVERFMRPAAPDTPRAPTSSTTSRPSELSSAWPLRKGRRPGFRGRPGRRRPPGGSPAAAYEAFLSGYAQAWMPAFAERLAAEARHPFYRAAAAYLGALVG